MTIIKEYHNESKIHNFTFDNTTINKSVIDKLRWALNSNFGAFSFSCSLRLSYI